MAGEHNSVCWDAVGYLGVGAFILFYFFSFFNTLICCINIVLAYCAQMHYKYTVNTQRNPDTVPTSQTKQKANHGN